MCKKGGRQTDAPAKQAAPASYTHTCQSCKKELRPLNTTTTTTSSTHSPHDRSAPPPPPSAHSAPQSCPSWPHLQHLLHTSHTHQLIQCRQVRCVLTLSNQPGVDQRTQQGARCDGLLRRLRVERDGREGWWVRPRPTCCVRLCWPSARDIPPCTHTLRPRNRLPYVYDVYTITCLHHPTHIARI